MYLSIKFRQLSGMMLATALTASTLAATYYVDSKFQGESPTGESWLSAFPSLQMAIEAASTNGPGQIWVKAGVYKPEGISKSATFSLPPNVEIYGGFRGNETKVEERNAKANRTVLTGDIGRIGSIADNSYHVITAAENCRIDSFIISRGNADSIAENRFGGGLLILPESKGVVVANCTFEKNSAEMGGAIHLSGGELTITNTTFYSNSGDSGGALAIQGAANVQILESIFSSNFAPKGGGAISITEESRSRISGTSFLYNSTDGLGGGLRAEAGKNRPVGLKISDCTFNGNSAGADGGALAFIGPFFPVVENSSFESNFSTGGAGAIANTSGTTAAILNATFAKNRGRKGSENIGFDAMSRVVKTQEEADQLAQAAQEAFQPLEPVKVPEAAPVQKKRKLADVFVYNSADHTKLKLRSTVARADYTVFVFGDLTDNSFIEQYRTIEAAARDYYPKGIRFYYIYRNLKHPENNGYIKAFDIRERARQSQLAKELLNTAVPWLYDEMDNQTAKALVRNKDAAVFIFSKEGEEFYAGALSDTETFRGVLKNLAGDIAQPFNIDSLPEPGLKPINIPLSTVTSLPQTNPRSDKFIPLQTTPGDSRMPYYVKARVEGNQELLESGNGKLYLGFYIDPLYNVEWNNLADPLKYTITCSKGVVAPSINTAPRVTSTATDSEPRGFILQARQLDLNQPMNMEITYSVYTTAKRTVEVTQQYAIYLTKDTFGGQAFGRQIPLPKTETDSKKGSANNSAFRAILRRYDLDRNRKLTKDEAIGKLQAEFQYIDLNRDDEISEKEFMDYRNQK
ncbi:hypothetical protein P4E94_14760 [Pontiellaceae bacterium B12219]|nr:hypothetical protein [Pontiellaceae bacterium B12219]